MRKCVIASAVLLASLLSACAESPQQRDAREAAVRAEHEQKLQRTKALNEAFDHNLEQKTHAHESPPKLTKNTNVAILSIMKDTVFQANVSDSDQGFAIVVCPTSSKPGIPELAAVDFTNYPIPPASFGVSRPSFTCANSAYGQEIIALRQWYCGDNLDCIRPEWNNGRPSWGVELRPDLSQLGLNNFVFRRYQGP